MARSITNWDKHFEAVDGGYVFRKYPFSRGVFMDAGMRAAFEAFMNAAMLRRVMEVTLVLIFLLAFSTAAPAGALKVLEWSAVPILLYVILYTLFLMDSWTVRLKKTDRADAEWVKKSLMAPPVAASGTGLYFISTAAILMLVAFTNVGIMIAMPAPESFAAFHWNLFWTGLPFNTLYLAGVLFLLTRVKGGRLADLPSNRPDAVSEKEQKQTADARYNPAHDPARRGSHTPFLGRRSGRTGRRQGL